MLVKFVILVFFQTALAASVQKQNYDVDDYEAMGHHFEEFIKTHNRQYSAEQKKIKFHIFIENVRKINELNEKFSDTTFGINHFTDMSEKERSLHFGLAIPTGEDPNGDCKLINVTSSKNSPPALDWRDKGFVSPVKAQGLCGSCWAFSAAALVESRCLQKGRPVLLSEQQLVDCDGGGILTCLLGGLPTFGLSTVMRQGGQESEADYPYEGFSCLGCRFDKSKVAAKVASCSVYSLKKKEEEAALQELLYKEGPLSIDNGEDYWIIKNSWGAGWGEEGYIRMKKGVGCCGIAISGETYATVSATVP